MSIARNRRYKPQAHFATIQAMEKDLLPTDYHAFLATIKTRIQQAQLRAVVAVNTELILLYWQIGKAIVERQRKEGWGAGVIAQLSKDLHAEFPQMKGFSERNLGYMKVFAQTYPDESFLQQVAAKLPWFHHCVLLEKVKDEKARLWYMEQAIEHGWSRNILSLQIETRLYQLDFVHFWKRQISIAHRGHGFVRLEKGMCRLSSSCVRQFSTVVNILKQRLMLENPWLGRMTADAR